MTKRTDKTKFMTRITTRIGDLFCIPIDGKYKVFFQYIEKDMTQMNSTVIRVFKKRYPIDYTPPVDVIVAGDVQFYAHTVLRPGLLNGTWEKVGKSNDLGNTNVYFRLTEDTFQNGKSYRWYVWKINEPVKYFGSLTKETVSYGLGYIAPYNGIVEKIKTGKYPLDENIL